MTTSAINTIDAKEEFSQLINRVSQNKERIILMRRGKEIAAIIPIEEFTQLQVAQNQADLNEALEALKEARKQGSLTLDELKTAIGHIA